MKNRNNEPLPDRDGAFGTATLWVVGPMGAPSGHDRYDKPVYDALTIAGSIARAMEAATQPVFAVACRRRVRSTYE